MLVKDLIRAKRLENGLSMKELGRLIGVSEATICRWENGTLNSMRHQTLKRLAEALGISPLDLLPPFHSEAVQSPTLELTEAERQLVEQYRRLDVESQQTVLDLIGVRLARIGARSMEK